jgi:hypothetical protein
MRRTVPLLALAALAAVPVGLALWPVPSPAQLNPGKQGAAPAALPPGPRLPVSRAVLYTSGVAYFQREGEVEGDASVELSFPVQDINDLLKSLVLRDLGGGQVTAVGYDSHDPISKTLKNFAVNLSDNPSFAQVLNQARGEPVEVTWRPPDRPTTQLKGAVLGMEKKKQPVGKDAFVEVEMLNLWADRGMRSLKLSEVAEVRFLNPVIDQEVKRALEVLARGHDTQRKAVRLSFRGKGPRQVLVGYVVEHPIWKTSYRLVLGEQKKPLLQGWAMVENPTGEDWNGVRVQLVSGRPISFRMDLYQPLYVDRPLVELELFAGLRPRAYEGEMPGSDKPLHDSKIAEPPEEGGPPMEKAKNGGGGGYLGPKEKGKQKGLKLPPARVADDIAGSVPAAAHGAKLGEVFQYDVAQPLTLPRQKSALVPIVNADIEATRVSIYNEKVQAVHPLLGVKLKNTTGLHLMQGPITVFEEGSYAGDALIRDVQPKEERLLSYAVDQAVEVKAEAKKEPEKLVSIRINKGTLERSFTLRESKTYRVKNRSDRARVVILEHPARAPEYKLITPAKAPPGSRDFYRFDVKVPRGVTGSFLVVEERLQLQQVALTNLDDDTLALLLQGPASPALKKALHKAIELRDKLATTRRDLERVGGRVKVIGEDQTRQRENMKVIPKTEPVYKKYLEKFLAQEEQLEKLRAEQERLQTTLDRQRQEYARFVADLTVKE